MKKIIQYASMLSAVFLSATTLFADELNVSRDKSSCQILTDIETQKCPACNTTERTEEVDVPFEKDGQACESTSCEHKSGGKWRCEFKGTHPTTGANLNCVVTYTKQADGSYTQVLSGNCRNLGPQHNQDIPVPKETNPDLSAVPDLAAAKEKAVELAAEHCKCKDECDKTNTCKIPEGYTPEVVTTNNNNGVTGLKTNPKILGTGAPRGCEGTVTIAVKVKCAGKCERKPRYQMVDEEECNDSLIEEDVSITLFE